MGKKIVALGIALLVVFVSYIFLASEINQSNNASADVLASPYASFSPAVTLSSGTHLIGHYSCEVKGEWGYVYDAIYAYKTSGGHLIYLAYDYVTSKNGYFLAGEEQSSGKWTGEIALRSPGGCYYNPHIGETEFTSTNWQIPGFQPGNDIQSGTSTTVSVGQSFSFGDTLCGATISGGYSVIYTYKVPMFLEEPNSMTQSNAEWLFSDNEPSSARDAASFNGSAATTIPTSDYGINQYAVSYYISGLFAQTGFWGNNYKATVDSGTWTYTP
ncbi:MAG: hypothetical protein LVQ96_05400 [Thermoplasmatales archaeon]|nr:hypothetical protein [Thermoplasmatales archaeon]MCW6170588.1 hypothetical protein [Thermoplasmatales archaeon]